MRPTSDVNAKAAGAAGAAGDGGAVGDALTDVSAVAAGDDALTDVSTCV